MSNSIAPGSSADVNVRVTALTTNPNVPVTYKTIILKKNLVNRVNTLTQEMISVANIKYVIKYDYVLGEDVTIPENCILEFDGGSISASGNNNTITGQNTGIQAGLVKIFNTDIALDGTWSIAEAYPEWFGAVGDGIDDDTNSVIKTVDSFSTIKLRQTYKCTNDINIKKDYTTICGKGKVVFDVSHVICAYNCDNIVYKDFTVETVAGYSGVGIRVGSTNAWTQINPNVKINYSNVLFDHITVDNYSHGYHEMIFGIHGIFVKTETGASFKDITIQNCTSRGSGCSPNALTDLNGCDNIYVSSYDTQTAQMRNVKILNNTCEYAGRQNISVAGDQNTIVGVVIKGNYLKDSTMAGIDLETANDVEISDNIFINSGKYTGYYDPAESTYHNNFSLQSAINRSGRSNAVVTGNIFRSCRNALGSYLIIVNCKLYNTPLIKASSASYAVTAVGCEFYFDNSFSDNILNFYAVGTARFKFENCSFTINGGNGIYLAGKSDISFVNCDILSTLAEESLFSINLNSSLLFDGCTITASNQLLVDQTSGNASEISIINSVITTKKIELNGRAKIYRIKDSIIDTTILGGDFSNATNCCIYVEDSEIHTKCAIVFAAYKKVCFKDNIFIFSNYDNTPISSVTDFNDAYLLYTAGRLENGKISIIDNIFEGVPDGITVFLRERNKSSTKALVYDIYGNMLFGNDVQERTITVKVGKTSTATGLIERNSFNGVDL